MGITVIREFFTDLGKQKLRSFLTLVAIAWGTLSVVLLLAFGLEIFLFTVGFFTLLIAGVGVANIMFVVVKERTREIGIKLAVGARKVHIITQFVFESLFISLLGGFAGLAVSVAIIQGVLALNMVDGPGQFLGKPEISHLAVSLTIGILVLIGLIAGIFPAIKASRVDPVESLRYE